MSTPRIILAITTFTILSGCSSVRVVAGGPIESPYFLVLREDVLLTSFAIACEVKDDEWRTHWKIVGETASGAIDFGVVPEGMRAEGGFVPLTSMGPVMCRVEVEARKKDDRRPLRDESFFVLLDTYIQFCSSERACSRAVIETIT